jgi:hypothetical protein
MKAAPFARARCFSAICCVLLLLTLFVGCASPRNQWAVARQSLTTTENAIVAANAAGVLPDKDLIAVEPFAKAAQGALKQADAELVANGEKASGRFDFYMNLVTGSLKSLDDYKKVAK